MREIIIETTPGHIKTFMDRTDLEAKRVAYFNHLPGNFPTSSILIKDDGIIHYSQSMAKVQISKESYYIRYYNKKGFTFDGKNLRVWFKNPFDQLNIYAFLKAMNMEVPSVYAQHITPTILKNILKGKIECTPIEILKAYFKANRLPREGVAPYFLKLETGHAISKHQLLMARDHATSVYDFIVNYTNDFNHEIIRNAQVLNEKIDFSKSTNELNMINAQFRARIESYSPF